MWTTEDITRRKVGLTSEDVEDTVLADYIKDAQKDMLLDIAHKVIDEKASGVIDGVNSTFSTAYYNYVDNDFDNSVTSADVKVYGWTNENDPSTKVSLDVTTVYPLYGKVVLTTAPSTNYVKITIDYYYSDFPIDSTLIPEACGILAAFYYALAEQVLMPRQWMHGAYRFLKDDVADLELRYWDKIHRITAKVHEIGTNEDVTFDRSSNL